MSSTSNSGKIFAIILILLVGAAAAYGYLNQSTVLSESETKTTEAPAHAADAPVAEAIAITPEAVTAAMKPKSTDIVLGDANAPVTIIEYSSLSCNHCAHFHTEVLPTLDKEFITPGKATLVLRHFPLNPPALKGAQLVECAGENGLKREAFIKTLFDMQSKWAFDKEFEKNLKQIASVGGIDSATFDGCIKDKSLEDRILLVSQEAQTTLAVQGTPAFFINGTLYAGPRTVDGFRTAISEAMKALK